MNQPSICPKCGAVLLPNTNFCPSCGFQISTIPQTVSVGRQIWIYIISILLPPLGFIWTFKYFRSDNPQKKRIAIIATILTIISLIFSIWLTLGFFQGIQSQYNQINTLQNLGV